MLIIRLPYDTSLAVNRQEVLSLAEFKGRILLWVQRIHLVKTQKRVLRSAGYLPLPNCGYKHNQSLPELHLLRLHLLNLP